MDTNITLVDTTNVEGQHAKKGSNFFLDRIPNFQELFIISSITGFIEASMDGFLSRFDGNPTSKSFIRDILKFPGTVAAVYSGSEVANTGNKYDIGHLVSQFSRLSCKAAMIQLSSFTYGPDSLERASSYSNILCEPVARFFTLGSEQRQKNNATDIGYFTYMGQKFTSSFLLPVVTESAAKQCFSFLTGEVINKLGLIKSASTSIDKMQSYLFNAVLHPQNSINFPVAEKNYVVLDEKIQIVATAIGKDNLNLAENSLLWFFEGCKRVVTNMGITTIMSPISRTAQDGSTVVLTKLHTLVAPLAAEIYNSVIVQNATFQDEQQDRVIVNSTQPIDQEL